MPHFRQSSLELREIYKATIEALCNVGHQFTLLHCAQYLSVEEQNQFIDIKTHYGIEQITPKNIYFATLKKKLGSDFDENLFNTIYETAFIRSRRSLHSKPLCYSRKLKASQTASLALELFLDVNTVAQQIKNHYRFHQGTHVFAPILSPQPQGGMVSSSNQNWSKFSIFSTYQPNISESPQLYMQQSNVRSLFLTKLALSLVNVAACLGLLLCFMATNILGVAVIAVICLTIMALNARYLWITSAREIDTCYHQLPEPEIIDIEQTFREHFQRVSLEELDSVEFTDNVGTSHLSLY